MDPKFYEHDMCHLTIHEPQILWMYPVSFNYLLTLNFMNVPCVNIQKSITLGMFKWLWFKNMLF
jgi:hypothetical protein